MKVFNNFSELYEANKSAEVGDMCQVDNMSPTESSYAKSLPDGKYRFMEMPPDNISY